MIVQETSSPGVHRGSSGSVTRIVPFLGFLYPGNANDRCPGSEHSFRQCGKALFETAGRYLPMLEMVGNV